MPAEETARLVCGAAGVVPAGGTAAVRWLDADDYPLAREAWARRGVDVTPEDWTEGWPAGGYRFAGVVEGGRLVSVAAALSWRPPSAVAWELAGVWTSEEARGRGLATAVCSFVTAHILASGRRATCGTRADNAAMLRVAQRLGYRRYVPPASR